MSKTNLVIVPESRYQQGVDFAEAVVATNYDEYMKRGQKFIDKLILDNRTGKMSEWAVHDYVLLRETQGRVLTTPDFGIYDKKTDIKKSFDPDLLLGDIRIHVKSQTYESMRSNGESWMFQRKDQLTSNPDPDGKDFIAFCLVDERNRAVIVRKLVRALDLVGLYQEPNAPHLKYHVVTEFYKQKCTMYYHVLAELNMVK